MSWHQKLGIVTAKIELFYHSLDLLQSKFCVFSAPSDSQNDDTPTISDFRPVNNISKSRVNTTELSIHIIKPRIET